MNSSDYEHCGLLWIKQTDGLGLGFEVYSMKPCKLQGSTAGSQGGLDKHRLSQKCLWRSVRQKMPMGKKIPTQNRGARCKTVKEALGRVLNESIANHSAMGWAESIK